MYAGLFSPGHASWRTDIRAARERLRPSHELAEFSHVFLSISLDIPSERPIFVRLPPSLSLGNISCMATCIISWIRNMWMTRVQNDIVRCNVLD